MKKNRKLGKDKCESRTRGKKTMRKMRIVKGKECVRKTNERERERAVMVRTAEGEIQQ